MVFLADHLNFQARAFAHKFIRPNTFNWFLIICSLVLPFHNLLPSLLSHLTLDACILEGTPILPTSESRREQQDTCITGKSKNAIVDHQLRSLELRSIDVLLQSYIVVGSLGRNKQLPGSLCCSLSLTALRRKTIYSGCELEIWLRTIFM